jgi:hypothetical protein
MMETLTAVVACALAFALSFYLGRGRAPSTWAALIVGAACGLGFAVAFFAMTVGTTIILPGTFAARSLGLHFLALLALAPLGSAVIAFLAHRHSTSKMRF